MLEDSRVLCVCCVVLCVVCGVVCGVVCVVCFVWCVLCCVLCVYNNEIKQKKFLATYIHYIACIHLFNITIRALPLA